MFLILNHLLVRYACCIATNACHVVRMCFYVNLESKTYHQRQSRMATLALLIVSLLAKYETLVRTVVRRVTTDDRQPRCSWRTPLAHLDCHLRFHSQCVLDSLEEQMYDHPCCDVHTLQSSSSSGMHQTETSQQRGGNMMCLWFT